MYKLLYNSQVRGGIDRQADPTPTAWWFAASPAPVRPQSSHEHAHAE
jgi:hypothetical protein